MILWQNPLSHIFGWGGHTQSAKSALNLFENNPSYLGFMKQIGGM